LASTPPTDVDLVYGHPDGTIRTYHVKNFVAEKGMKLLDIRNMKLSATGSPTPDNPILMLAGNTFVYLGAGIVIDHYFGGIGLIVAGITLLWWRQIWLRAIAMRAPKATEATKDANRS
jgi:hypothetical protein